MFHSKSPPVSFCSIYSSDDDDEDVEMYDHDYDGLLPKAGKRHLGKTRWTREEVNKGSLTTFGLKRESKWVKFFSQMQISLDINFSVNLMQMYEGRIWLYT